MVAGRGPRDVLIVGWYPGADDPIAGRFIADQAAALAETGRVRPLVASFEPFWLHGDRALRERAAGAWPAAIRDAAVTGLVPTPSSAFGPGGIPVARLGAPVGRAPGAAADHEAVHRERTLLAALPGIGRPVELVHGHVGYPEGAAAARVAAGLDVPFVLTEHATYLARILADPALRARYRAAALAAARVIAVGGMLADQLRAELPEIAGRLVVIPNTVDIASFPVVDPAARDADELLWVGYRREVKGTGVLLRAFARVREARPTTTLRLLGRSVTDAEEVGWHELAARLGITGAVRFDGPTDRAGVAEAMARAGLFVHPSTRETFGMVAVEALACGLPVVATDSGGVTEVLGAEPEVLGGLVPAGDPEVLANEILRVLDRRSGFDPASLRAHVERRYAGPAVAGRIADLYEQVLAEAAASRGPRRSSRRGGSPIVLVGSAPAPPVPASAVAIPDHPVLVAFDRPALDRVLPKCPPWLLEGLVVVTRGGDVPGVGVTVAVPAELGTSIADLLAWRAAGRPFRSPARWVRSQLRHARVRARVQPALEEAVDRGLEAARAAGAQGTAPGDAIPLLLCLGGIDVASAVTAVRAGRARFAPGGLRWLGDVRWVAGRAEAPAGQAEAAAGQAEAHGGHGPTTGSGALARPGALAGRGADGDPDPSDQRESSSA